MDFDLKPIQDLIDLAGTGIRTTGHAVDLLGRIKGLFQSPKPPTDADVKTLLAELVSEIADAKVANAEMKFRLLDLHEHLAAANAVQRNLDRYELHRTEAGSIVYALKDGEDCPAGPHFICPNCYEQRMRTILQGSIYRKSCARCQIWFNIATQPPALAPTGRPWIGPQRG